jgi:hypothetical protein
MKIYSSTISSAETPGVKQIEITPVEPCVDEGMGAKVVGG